MTNSSVSMPTIGKILSDRFFPNCKISYVNFGKKIKIPKYMKKIVLRDFYALTVMVGKKKIFTMKM